MVANITIERNANAGPYDFSESMRASHWGIVLALPVLFIDEVMAAFGPGDALAAHREHQRQAFGRRQGAATKLSDNAAIAISGGYQEKCKAKLRAANINPDDFEFAPEILGDETAGGELRVVWMNENPHCFKRRHGRCVPLFERDWLYDWLLRDVPVRRPNMLKVSGCKTIAHHAAYIFNGVLSCGMDDVEALGRALQVCDLPGMLVHFGDENGLADKELGYKYCPLILRQYFAKEVEDRWGDKLLVVPLGYSANFWHDFKDEAEWIAADPRSKKAIGRAVCTGKGNCSPPANYIAAKSFLEKTSQREHTWSFFGDVKKSTRPEMAKALATVPKGFSFQSHGFAGNDMRRPVELREVMSHSKFCPAPTGWYNPDSYRYSESLEVGCFPLVDGRPSGEWQDYLTVTEHYWEGFFKYYGLWDTVKAFVHLVDKWSDTPKFIASKLEDTQDLDKKQEIMMRWWYDYKDTLARKIGMLVRERIFRQLN